MLLRHISGEPFKVLSMSINEEGVCDLEDGITTCMLQAPHWTHLLCTQARGGCFPTGLAQLGSGVDRWSPGALHCRDQQQPSTSPTFSLVGLDFSRHGNEHDA